jgi:phosphomevalonate kinase
MRKVLAISGKRFTGKDTLAALLTHEARQRGHELACYAFAGECKRRFAMSMTVDLERLSSDRAYKEQWRPTLTQFTVDSLATDPLVFVRAVAERMEQDSRPPILSDLRLRVELDWLRPRFDLRVVRLIRSDEQRARSGWQFDADKDLHYTETELDDPALWDEVVENDGDLAALNEKAAALLSRFLA